MYEIVLNMGSYGLQAGTRETNLNDFVFGEP